MPIRSSRADSDIAPTATPNPLIPTSGSVPATTGARTVGPSSATSIDDPDGALVAGVPLLGMTQERPVRAVDHHVGASLERLRGGRPELDLPVDLLERVGRHEQRERLLRAVGHAAQLLDEVRQRGLGRRHVRREHMVERTRPDAVRLEVALDEAERVVDPLTEPAADRTPTLERRARRPHHDEAHDASDRHIRTPTQGRRISLRTRRRSSCPAGHQGSGSPREKREKL